MIYNNHVICCYALQSFVVAAIVFVSILAFLHEKLSDKQMSKVLTSQSARRRKVIG